jgi:hypothetical protein
MVRVGGCAFTGIADRVTTAKTADAADAIKTLCMAHSSCC